jgi:hypothetical protein
MTEGCQQITLAFFGESWPPSVKPRRIENPLRLKSGPQVLVFASTCTRRIEAVPRLCPNC